MFNQLEERDQFVNEQSGEKVIWQKKISHLHHHMKCLLGKVRVELRVLEWPEDENSAGTQWTCRAARNSFPRSCLVNFLNLLISFYSVRVHQYLVNFPNVLITFFAVGLHQSSSLFSLLFLELIQPQ